MKSSKIIEAHVQSLENTIASLKDEQSRIQAEIKVFESALKLFGRKPGIVTLGKTRKPGAVTLGKTQQLAYDLLQRNRKVAVADVAKAAGISGSAASQALYKLEHKKLAKRKGRGKFELR